jgi:hypothetical protein
MKLDEFVSQTLIQIIEGVANAQQAVEKSGGSVSPAPFQQQPTPDEYGLFEYNKSANSYRKIQQIKFDVALTTTEDSGKAGGAGVSVGVLTIGGKATSTESSTSAGRIQFEVDIALPRRDRGRE